MPKDDDDDETILKAILRWMDLIQQKPIKPLVVHFYESSPLFVLLGSQEEFQQ